MTAQFHELLILDGRACSMAFCPPLPKGHPRVAEADVEEGHEVSVACHLANLSMRLGRKLRWDVKKEEIIGDREASAQLVRPYRQPWDEVLRSLNL